VARDFTGEQTPKYLNSPGDKYMWGFQPDVDTVVLAEGIIKAMRIRTATGQHTATLLGHALASAQRKQLESSKCQHVVLWPDPDRVGRQGVCKIADDLVGSWPGKVSVVWPVSKPADDMTMAEIQDAWKNATPYTWCTCQKMSLAAG
jgi:DNA primase